MRNFKSLLLAGVVLISTNANSQNPIIRDQFSADPTARIFNGKVYLFPSHDIPAPESFPRKDWFCMADYHVFSSTNLTDWTDHGVIVSQDKIGWVNPTSYSMWAPDCIERNGKYYFYFPANVKTGKGFGIGVAIADKPEGPYVPHPEPITNVRGIDPCVFINKDGQAYIYYSLNRIFVAKLKDNIVEIASEPKVIGDLPAQGLVEGPYLFERNGIYYMTYPHVQNKIERLEYAVSDNPMGPFKVTGVIMDESPTGCWTNHHSIIQYNNQWYLFYHHNDLSPKFDKNRSVRVDSLFFNSDGTIRKVIPTLRGVGLTEASKKIEIDRYSQICDKGVSITFLDSLNTFNGWKTVFNASGAWIKYNSVDFGRNKFRSVNVRALSKTGGVLQIRLNNAQGIVVAEVKIQEGNVWNTVKARVSGIKPGVQNLVLMSKENKAVEVDWISFE